jgi:hypothetical protein
VGRFHPRRLALLLPLLSCMAPVAQAYMLDTCTDYHCDIIVPVALHSGEIAQIEQLFKNTGTPDEERERIARAIGLFETLIGPKNGTSEDLAMNPPDAPQSPRGGQLDCISESTNSTTYLKQLETAGLLKWHSVDERAVRRRWLFGVHWTAVISDREGMQYAVDSWYGKNGEPAIILPLEKWHEGEER